MKGVILWQSRTVVCIGTFESANAKTGNMCQIWVLVRNADPIAANHSGLDRHNCGNCPLRGIKGRRRLCNVDLRNGPGRVWHAWRRGLYPELASIGWGFAGRMIRFGAYGDPAAVPLRVWKELAAVAAGWTGYTHQWETAPGLKPFMMASADNEEDARRAQAAGWRTYRVRAIGAPLMAGEINCPANKKNRVQCINCRLCGGNSTGAADISIEATGIQSKRWGEYV